jgi:hypothetical protein
LTRNQLAAVLLGVFGVRGGVENRQAPTVALGWRENWTTLFVAIQGRPLSQEFAVKLQNECQPTLGYLPAIVDARAEAGGDYNWIRNGFQTASTHAEMLVLAAMMRHRMENAYHKQNQAYVTTGNPGKYNQAYLLNRYTNRRDVAVLAAKFNQAGRRIRIVANAQACYFCWNMLNDLQIECGGLDETNALNVARGDRPLTGWWNPINDTVYSHGTPPWTNQIPGIR